MLLSWVKVLLVSSPSLEKEILADPLAELGFKTRAKKTNIKKQLENYKKPKMEQMRIADIPLEEKPYKTYIRKIKVFYKAHLSPAAVRNFLTQTRFGRIWMVFNVIVTIMAIVNYVLLTYLARREDRGDRKIVKTLDLAYAGIFLIDFLLSLYTAEDALKLYFKWSSLIDMVSIVTPFVVISNLQGQYVWFVGLIRIFKATRINRTYKILSFSQNEETRELTLFVLNFLNFMFFSASIINATETLVDNWRSPATLLNWHDSLYYIMVTFSTIGFGDLTPSSTISRIVVMCLIILGLC